MSNTITPSMLVAITGICNVSALQVSPVITNAISSITAYASSISGSNPTLSANLTTAASSLSTQSNIVLSGFTSFIGQVLSHITTVQTITNSVNFVSKIQYTDLGSGITDITSLSDQGLSETLGNLLVVAEVIQNASKVYDITHMESFGLPGGLVSSTMTNKLANYAGVNAQLSQYGVDPNQLNDSRFYPQIINALRTITDQTILDTVTDHYGLGRGSITNLADLLNINLYTKNATQIHGGFQRISTKMTDLGVKFKKVADAVAMLTNISTPNVSNLAVTTDRLSSFANLILPNITNMTGGNPTIYDFFSTITSNAFINSFSTTIPSQGMVDQLTTQINHVNSLFSMIGVQLNQPVPVLTLVGANGFVGRLYNCDIDTANVIIDLTTSSVSGQAIEACLVEGNNISNMAINGIAPLKFI